VNDGVHIAHGVHDVVDVAEVRRDDLQTWMVQLTLDRFCAIEQQIEHSHVITFLEKLRQQRGTDVTRSSNHEDATHLSPFLPSFQPLVQVALQDASSDQSGEHQDAVDDHHR
jgi:hypothetical protein